MTTSPTVDWQANFGHSREDIYKTLFAWVPELHKRLAIPFAEASLFQHLQTAGHGYYRAEDQYHHLIAEQSHPGFKIHERPELGRLIDKTHMQQSVPGWKHATIRFDGLYLNPQSSGRPKLEEAWLDLMLASNGEETRATFSRMGMDAGFRFSGTGKEMARCRLRTCLFMGCNEIYLDDIQQNGGRFWMSAGALPLDEKNAFEALFRQLHWLSNKHDLLFHSLKDIICAGDVTRLREIARGHIGDSPIGHDLCKDQHFGTLYLDLNNTSTQAALKEFMNFDVLSERAGMKPLRGREFHVEPAQRILSA